MEKQYHPCFTQRAFLAGATAIRGVPHLHPTIHKHTYSSYPIRRKAPTSRRHTHQPETPTLGAQSPSVLTGAGPCE
eukprot:30881-Eustigmatos_ZCMA.PRE.1